MMNPEKLEQGARLLLEGMGEDIHRPGLIDTPKRIAKSYQELFGGLTEDVRPHLEQTFPAENNELVLEKDIPFYSTCEHHLLPFFGVAHIAYVPNGKVVGLSKMARVVDIYARRPQIQEQLTAQIADAMMEFLEPAGVMVVIEAEHLCMTMRGIKKPGTKTMTMLARGDFETNQALRDNTIRMIGY